jgi:hypothetical protein
MEMPFEAFELQDQDEDGHFANGMIEFMQQHQTFGNVTPDFIQKKTKKKKKETNNLDSFLEGTDGV